jgi:hypothetical protein
MSSDKCYLDNEKTKGLKEPLGSFTQTIAIVEPVQ